MLRTLLHGVRAMFRGRRADRDVDEELQQFVDEAAADLEARGVPANEARRRAERAMGNRLVAREEVRASGWEHAVEQFAGDIRQGMRTLRRAPAFAIITISTLGLGIGASTAMMSVAGPVLFNRLPYQDADHLHMVWDRASDGSRLDMTFGSFLEIEARSRAFDSLAVIRTWQPTLTGEFEPERLDGQGVSDRFFRVLGVKPAMGRDFTEKDDAPNAPPVVVISHALWQRRLGSDPAIVGRALVLDGNSYTVIGVLPPMHHALMPTANVWRTIRYDRALPSPQGREWGHHLRMIGRRATGVSEAVATSELDLIARNRVTTFSRPPWAAMSAGLLMPSLHHEVTGDVQTAVIAVMTAVALLLAIACVNVANLILARGAHRRPEFVMRAALGAGRLRLFRQLLTETLVIAVLGGVAGIAVAFAGVRALALFMPAALLPQTGIAIDTPVFVFALATTVLAGLAVGVVPALRTARENLRANTPQASRQAVSTHNRTRRGLVTAEVAFALVLLVGAMLLSRSLQQLFAISPGFDPSGVLTMQVQVAGQRFRDPEVTQQYFRDVLAAVRTSPGVISAGLTSQLPLSGDSDVFGVHFESGNAPAATDDGGAFRYAVSDGYFDVMGIPLQRGRLLTDRDRAGTTPVVVINESFARGRFGARDPIGQRLHIGPTNREWFTVIGVVGDVKQESLSASRFNATYVAPSQWFFTDNALWIVAKTQGGTAALMPAIRQAIRAVDKDQPIVRVAMMDDLVTATAGERRFALLLFEVFGAGALLLTAIGIYGVVSGVVTERVREIGVRTALGASRGSILAMVMRQGLWLSLAGVAIGVVTAALASQGMTTLLFGISPLDPLSYAAVVLVLLGVAVIASGLPAWRASRVDPSVTLRSD